jgi:hypothetical protein
MSSTSSNPLIIVTGHRKAGTSLLHRLFDGVPGLNVYPSDMSILYAYFPCFTANASLTNTELESRLCLVVKNSLDYMSQHNEVAFDVDKFLNIMKSKIINTDLRSKFEVVMMIRQSWLDYQELEVGALPFLFKETSQSVFFEKYLAMFPNLKMISIIRDPRDNFAAINEGIRGYYSHLGEGDMESLSSLINRARMDMISAKINQKKHPKAFLAIRFEDLVVDPRSTMQAVSSFLNMKFDEKMLIPTALGNPYKGNSYGDNKSSNISSEKIGNWKSRIPASSAKIIEYWLAKEMKDWSYKTDFSLEQSQLEFSSFYEWYNCKYFYNDSYQ